MKRLFIILLFIIISQKSASQPSELFEHTWYLHYVEFDLEGGYSISSFQPPINPYLIIHEDLTFEGFGACNEFSGHFQYAVYQGTEMLYPFEFERTNIECINQEHIAFETNYFEWFDHDDVLRFSIYCNSNNDCEFILEYYAGFLYIFSNSPILNLENFNTPFFNIYPNPTEDLLNITTFTKEIEELCVYNLAGIRLINNSFENQIDVTMLPAGIYFVEITSPEGKFVQKFIKK